MRVLIACEFSGIVRDAFTANGHDAISCDLLPTELPGKHYHGDVRDILGDSWDLMIACPPCTHLAVSGARWFKKKQKEQTEALEFVRLLLNAPIPRIALENPVSIISSRIRKPDQIIQPWMFGDSYPKKTCLWLKNLPPLFSLKTDSLFGSKTFVSPEYLIYKSSKTKSGVSRYSVFGKLGKGCGKKRSVTFPGIAKAMAEQWGSLKMGV